MLGLKLIHASEKGAEEKFANEVNGHKKTPFPTTAVHDWALTEWLLFFLHELLPMEHQMEATL